MQKRVAITGLGMISPLGNTVAATWSAILAGKSGISRITRFDPSRVASQIAGEVNDFKAEEWVVPREAPFMDPFVAYGAAAARQALDDSKLLESDVPRDLVGVSVGSAMGGFNQIARQADLMAVQGPRRVPPLFIPFILPDSSTNAISIQHHLTGPNFVTVSACATGANAVGESFGVVARGEALAMVAGGTDALVGEMVIAGFSNMRALSVRNDDPEKASRPFDVARDGFVLSEGAAALVLEEWDHAVARGATIYAEVVGYATNADGHHITQPRADGAGATACMALALKRAGVEPSQVGYINAHGTSTQVNDLGESRAIKEVWGPAVAQVAVSSTKSMTGHMLGAAGAIEAAFCALALRDEILPPTINLDEPGPECDLNFVRHTARVARCEYAVSNSFGFGGHNVSLVFRAAR